MAKHAPGFLKVVNDAKTRIRECTVSDVKKRQDAGEVFHLVDVREESEWSRGHLPNATHLGKGVIERDIEVLAEQSGHAHRTAAAADGRS